MAYNKRETIMTDAQMEAVTKTTAQLLADQPKRKIKLHLPYEELTRLNRLEEAGKTTNWPYELASVNGHNFYIKLGKEVEVPESVYEVLSNAHLV